MSETILNMLPLMEEEKNAFEAAAPDAVHLYAGRRTATPEQFAQATVILGWPRPEMVAQAEHLKWFQSMFAGTDEYVDVMPAGALLTSSAGSNSQSVAEHLLATLLALYRKLPLCRDRQREHKWDQDIGSVRTLVGATVLVAGAGHVGSAFAQLCKALGAKQTIGLKRSVNVPVPGFDALFPLSELDRLLPRADVVALTLPHTPETDGLMNRARLSSMKEDAVPVSYTHLLRRGGQQYAVSPYGLIWNNDNYYLVAYDSANREMRHYRVDKMTGITVTDNPLEAVSYTHLDVYKRQPSS